jgi:hypothetical protein
MARAMLWPWDDHLALHSLCVSPFHCLLRHTRISLRVSPGDAVERIQQRLHELQFLFQQRGVGLIPTQGRLMDVDCGDKAQKLHILCVQPGVWRTDVDDDAVTAVAVL